MSCAIDNTQHCTTMDDVRRHIDALDDMTQAARIKQDENQVRDEERIEAIIERVRARAAQEGGEPEVIEAIYRSMMEAYIAFEHGEFARLRGSAPTPG